MGQYQLRLLVYRAFGCKYQSAVTELPPEIVLSDHGKYVTMTIVKSLSSIIVYHGNMLL